MLSPDNCVLTIVDIQGKLAQLMTDKDRLFGNLQLVTQGVKLFNIPVLWLEQLPEKLGPTIPELAACLPDQKPISKSCFSACDSGDYMFALGNTRRQQVLLAGIEAHICVYQTCKHLIARNYEVHLLTDCISSRHPDNRKLAIDRMVGLGAIPTSVEMALYEMQRYAEGDRFCQMVKLVKDSGL